MEQQTPNLKSDVEAKQAFARVLSGEGFTDVRIASAPVDIIAIKNGKTWYFEIKFTRATGACFGAATLTEWATAAEHPDSFQFVIAHQEESIWQFERYSPEEFMAYSSVPPFKIYFNVPLTGERQALSSKLTRKIRLTKNRLRLLTRQFEELRALEN